VKENSANYSYFVVGMEQSTFLRSNTSLSATGRWAFGLYPNNIRGTIRFLF
jgi:hypothetical protein